MQASGKMRNQGRHKASHGLSAKTLADFLLPFQLVKIGQHKSQGFSVHPLAAPLIHFALFANQRLH
jgi:hypothetical protein